MRKQNDEVSKFERKNYVLKEKRDLEILSKVKKLEKRKLSKKNREIARLIKTQLKADWRTPLINYLNRLLKITK